MSEVGKRYPMVGHRNIGYGVDISFNAWLDVTCECGWSTGRVPYDDAVIALRGHWMEYSTDNPDGNVLAIDDRITRVEDSAEVTT